MRVVIFVYKLTSKKRKRIKARSQSKTSLYKRKSSFSILYSSKFTDLSIRKKCFETNQREFKVANQAFFKIIRSRSFHNSRKYVFLFVSISMIMFNSHVEIISNTQLYIIYKHLSLFRICILF
jgi:hypothetical protein